MSDFFNALSDAMIAAAAQPWALAALFILCVADGFFPVVPSETFVIAMASVSVHPGNAPWWAILLLAAAGALTGDLIAFTIGRRVPLDRVPGFRRGRGKALLGWAHHQIRHRTGRFLLTARYIPFGRVAVNITAGAKGLPLSRFLRYDSIAALTWAAYNTAIGTVAGHLFHNAFFSTVVGIVGGLLIGTVVDQIARRLTKAPAKG